VDTVKHADNDDFCLGYGQPFVSKYCQRYHLYSLLWQQSGCGSIDTLNIALMFTPTAYV
jgi:hypothetical protein